MCTMMNARRWYSLLSIVTCIVLLVGVPLWIVLRHADLDRRLLAAIDRGELARAKSCIRDGADVNGHVIRTGTTAFACPVLDVLRPRKRASTPSRYVGTPLIEAVRQDKMAMAAVLLENGARPNARDSEGQTALMLIWDSPEWRGGYSVLTKYGADVSLCDVYGADCLDFAVGHLNWEGVLMLLKASPRANVSADWKRRYGEILIDACGNSETEIVSRLLDLGADPNYKSSTGYTPLVNAVLSDDLDTAKVLLERGASVDLRSKGDTPMVCARGKENKAMVKLLLKYRAR